MTARLTEDEIAEIERQVNAPDPPGITTTNPGCVPRLLAHIRATQTTAGEAEVVKRKPGYIRDNLKEVLPAYLYRHTSEGWEHNSKGTALTPIWEPWWPNDNDIIWALIEACKASRRRQIEAQQDKANALTARAAPEWRVPDGWQLVPKEPTEEMARAGRDAVMDATSMTDYGGWTGASMEYDDDAGQQVWRAMLSAAPVAPESE